MQVRVIPATRKVPSHAEAPAAPVRPKIRVAAYCRVSTDLEEQESSYEAQIRHYTELISSHSSWAMAGIYADEGISGTQTKKRDRFNAMIADCESDQIDMVITKSISRFARNTLDCLQYIRKLKALGIPILFEKENINTLDSSGELLITIMASIAQQESQSISQNVRMGIQYRFQQGKPMLQHNWFLGYTKEQGGDLQIVPEQADAVRMIYRYFLEGMTIGDIAREMEAQGYQTGAGRDRWYFSTVNSILRNEKYMGDLILQKGYTADFLTKKKMKNNGTFPKYYVENAHAPIVPREIFMQVQSEFLRREAVKEETGKAESHRGNLALNGRIVCAQCGNTCKRVHASSEALTTWRCRTRMQKGTPCKGRIVKETAVKAAVMDAMTHLPDRQAELEQMREALSGAERAALQEQILAVQEEEEKLQAQISLCAKEEEQLPLLQERLHEVRTRKEALLRQKAQRTLRLIHIRMLLDRIDAILGKEIPRCEPADPACRDLEDFFARTNLIAPRGPITEYSDQDVLRYLEKIEVHPDRISVVFRAGIKIDVWNP